jgi:hypothetical protein
MNKERAIALNHAFIAFCILGVISITLSLGNIPFTQKAYDIPFFYSRSHGVEYYLLPQLPIYWLVITGTLLTFNISLLINEWDMHTKSYKHGALFSAIIGGITGLLFGIFGNAFGVGFSTIAGIVLGVGGLTEGAKTGFKVFTIFGCATTASVNVFLVTTLYTSLGIGEGLILGGLSFISIALGLFIINAIAPLIVAICERLLLVIHTPEATGTPRPTN